MLTTDQLIERLGDLTYNLNDWDFPITARDDLKEASVRLKRYENGLKAIRTHIELSLASSRGMSSAYNIADNILRGKK